jgi:hypothetical protein
MCSQTQRGNVSTLITLECTCGEVLHGALFLVDDALNRQAVREEDWGRAAAHLDFVRRLSAAATQAVAPAALEGNPS